MLTPIACSTRLVARMRFATAVVAALGVMWALAGAPAAAKRSGMKKASKSAQKSFDAVLDDQKSAVVGCVMTYGIQRGAPKVTLDIKVLINRQGSVFNLDLKVTGGDTAELSTCVKDALNKVQFPATGSALTELRRQWTFAST